MFLHHDIARDTDDAFEFQPRLGRLSLTFSLFLIRHVNTCGHFGSPSPHRRNHTRFMRDREVLREKCHLGAGARQKDVGICRQPLFPCGDPRVCHRIMCPGIHQGDEVHCGLELLSRSDDGLICILGSPLGLRRGLLGSLLRKNGTRIAGGDQAFGSSAGHGTCSLSAYSHRLTPLLLSTGPSERAGSAGRHFANCSALLRPGPRNASPRAVRPDREGGSVSVFAP